MRYDLTQLGSQKFEEMSQALALAVLGDGVSIFGAGPDGGREAVFEGRMRYPEPIPAAGHWSGYGVLQAKFKRTPTTTRADTDWLLREIRKELRCWTNRDSARVQRGRLPEYLAFTTNVSLSPVPRSGGIDRVDELISSYVGKGLPLRDWAVWHHDQICSFLDVHDGVRRAFDGLIMPGDVLAETSRALIRLRDRRATEVADAAHRGKTATKPVWDWLGPPITLVSREHELRHITATLADGRKTTPAVVVLSGIGGVGKTSLARAYVRSAMASYGVVAVVRAESSNSSEGDFRELLSRLCPDRDIRRVVDARTEVFAQLHEHADRWLLVLDNVSDIQSASRMIPPTGAGDVLITTRESQSRWSQRTYELLTVEPLDENSSARLLLAETGQHDFDSARALAVNLGRIPLALCQAAATIRTMGWTIQQYLHSYHDLNTGPRLRATEPPPDYPHTMSTAIEMSLDLLTAAEWKMLGHMAFYATDAIPLALLHAPGQDDFTTRQTVSALRRSSLITEMGPDTVSIHGIVQTVTRDRLHARGSWTASMAHAHRRLDQTMPRNPVTPSSLARWNSIRTHAYSLVAHLPPRDPMALATRRAIAQWTGFAGDTVAARGQHEQLVTDHEQALGLCHPDTLLVRRRWANWIGHNSDPDLARQQLRELHTTCERDLDADSPTALEVRHALAWWTGEADEPAAAHVLYRTLLRDRIRVQGEKHMDTLRTWHNLAHWTGLAGNGQGARDLFEQLVEVEQEVLPSGHHHTLAARTGHAFWTCFVGDTDTASALFEELVRDYVDELGETHRDTLFAMHYQAINAHRNGDHDKAIDLATLVAEVREQVLGAKHQETIKTHDYLAAWTLRGLGPQRT